MVRCPSNGHPNPAVSSPQINLIRHLNGVQQQQCLRISMLGQRARKSFNCLCETKERLTLCGRLRADQEG